MELYILSSSAGIEVGVLTYGGIIPFLRVPDKAGNPVDIVLGYDSIAEYENGSGYLGALIGRCANRIGKGRFTLTAGNTHSPATTTATTFTAA